MTFVISLYTKLHSEIGQKSPKSSGEDIFGIKERKVELIAPKTVPLILYFSIALSIFPPKKSKQARNVPWSSFLGQGFFILPRPIKTLLIPSSE